MEITFVSTAFNMLAWSLDLAGDLVGYLTKTHNYAMAMNLAILLSCGLAPIVYMAGAMTRSRRPAARARRRKYQIASLLLLKGGIYEENKMNDSFI